MENREFSRSDPIFESKTYNCQEQEDNSDDPLESFSVAWDRMHE